eukprot:6233858-Pyramimonas_sp.AAC.1
MRPWPFAHIANYPPSPEQLPGAIYKHIYKDSCPASALSEKLVSDYGTLVPTMVYKETNLVLKKEKDSAAHSKTSPGSYSSSSASPDLRDAVNQMRQATAQLQAHAPGWGMQSAWGGQLVPAHPPGRAAPQYCGSAPAPFAADASHCTGVVPASQGVPPGGAVMQGGVIANLGPGVPVPKVTLAPSSLPALEDAEPEPSDEVGDAAEALDGLMAASSGS